MKTLAFTLALLTLTAAAVAQGQTLTFGVNPGQTTAGNGQLGVVVGGFGTIPINVPPSTGSLGIATAMTAALQAQGFTVQQNGTEVTVTAGPGGAPLQNGGGIGSTDSGITGVKAKVHKQPPPPGPGPNPNPPGNKNNGGQVPKAQGAGQANQGGSVQIDAEVWKLVGGVWQLLWIQVQVPILPGDDADAINQRARQALEAAGLKVNEITLPQSIAPITPVPCFGLDRTDTGDTVQSVLFRPQGGALPFFPVVFAGAGQMPLFGPTDLDIGLRADGSENGFYIEYNGTHGLPGNGTFDAFVDPFGLGAWQIGFGGVGQLWQAPVIPLPPIGPHFYSVLDPFALLSVPMLPDPLGHMQLPLLLPPSPGLTGLELQLQAVVIDPTAPNLLGSVQRTPVTTLGIGP